MKAIKLVAVAAALSVSGFAMADARIVKGSNVFEAQQLIPSGVRAEVGTTGYGGALLWTANPYVGLALGYNGGDISWSNDIKVNDTKYDWKQDNKTAYLNAEVRPFGASDNAIAQGLYFAAGVGYIDNDYKLKGRPGSNGTVKVNGNTYGTNVGNITGNIKYDNDFAPYVGLGFAPKFGKNFGVFGEVGAYYTGNPEVSLKNSGSQTALDVNNNQTIANALKADANKIRNDDKYEWLPVGKVGVNFYW